MAVNKTDLYVSQILEDLDNGLTWLKRDDIGYGSIQEKYNAKDQQIVMIRKHPALKDAETNITVFNIIDDTKDERTATLPVNNATTTEPVASVSDTSTRPTQHATGIPGISNESDGKGNTEDATVTDEQSADAFFNI